MTATDKDKIADIYEELRLICYHVALAVTKDHAMADDAVHNAFLAVIKHRNEIFTLTQKKRRSKILIITKNKAIDLLRQVKPDSLDEAEEIADTLNLCDIIEEQESYEHLINCINNLPCLYKCAFELRYVHDLSNQEIAEILGITNKAVSTRIARAKLMLQKQLL